MYKKRLEKAVVLGCQNACPSVAYLQATEAAVCGGSKSDSELLALLAQRILTVSNFQNVRLEACIHEEAGYACWQRGLTSEAKQHFQQALHIQEKMGALAKYNWLSNTINV
jgi:hypothetical protein